MKVIDRFTWKFEGQWHHTPLSNFSDAPFRAAHFHTPMERAVDWATTEHYYQAARCKSPEDAETVRLHPTAGGCKNQAHAIKKAGGEIPDWFVHTIPVMRKALAYKFDPFEKGREADVQFLLDTGDAMLIEGNTWKDEFWGCVPGPADVPPAPSHFQIGENWLGWLLMAQRAHIRAALINNQGRMFP